MGRIFRLGGVSFGLFYFYSPSFDVFLIPLVTPTLLGCTFVDAVLWSLANGEFKPELNYKFYCNSPFKPRSSNDKEYGML